MPLPKDHIFFNLAKTMEQDQFDFVNAILDNTMVLSDSPAGSGKTTMALGALRYLQGQKKIDHVFYLFSPVEEKVLGFTEGNLEAKEDKYTGPLDDALVALNCSPMQARISLKEYSNKKKFQSSEDNYWVTPMSHVFLRGRNFKRAGIIIDEAQNWTRQQFKKALSRFHEDCHIVVVGHTGQIDIPEKMSYFQAVIDHYSKLIPEKPVKIVPMTKKNYRGWISEHADLL